MILHFSYFNFWGHQPSYALRAQVFIPRLLGIVPYLILALGTYKANGYWTPVSLLLLSSAVWMSVFVFFRKNLIVWLRSKHVRFQSIIPAYVPIKNGAYPAKFIWIKQWRWIMFRVSVMLFFFLIFIFQPIKSGQFLGASSVVIFGFGTWLILTALVNMFEKYIRFPVSFSLLVLVIVFSFFNNNHAIRISDKQVDRTDLVNHFDNWLEDKSDSSTVYLVAAEGGGIRSAYWTANVLAELDQRYPNFDANTYAYSSVSGGSLGTLLYRSLKKEKQGSVSERTKLMLQNDFLAPVTAALIFPDLVQKFIPFAIKRLDRARVLEHSWEKSWKELPNVRETDWSQGFLTQFSQKDVPCILLNSTHVESGYRTVVSNVDLTELASDNIIDLFSIQKYDIPVSTAIGLSARFPLLTPPARIESRDGEVWGHLVDGGYYENIGATTIMDVYSKLRRHCDLKYKNIRFKVIALRNTKSTDDYSPQRGMTEILPPLITLSHIWEHNGEEVLRKGSELLEQYGDELIEIKLSRDDKENIPLGWYLSKSAQRSIEKQIMPQMKLVRLNLENN